MSAHKILFDQFQAGDMYAIADAASATFVIDRSPAYIGLKSVATETRTIARPTVRGASLLIAHETDGGDITVTVTGGYNENGDTTFVFTDPGQFMVLESMYESVAAVYQWRKVADHNSTNSSLALPTPATPAAVATSPGTAAPAEMTATGGVGGNTSIATTGVGGVGGGYSLVAGAGGVATAAATSGTGGVGGAISETAGAGGAQSVAGTTEIGGAGGAVTLTTGAGGAVSGAVTTATGGAGGLATIIGGVGGAVTATTGTNTGGAGGGVALTGGVGGAASAATDTGGVGGSITISSGDGGAGDTGGAAGTINLVTGAVGAGGSPVAGKILFKLGGTERFGFYGTTVGVFTSLGAVPTNINAAGTILPGGGIAITDVLNAWIDDATHGAGTVAHLIGNQTITTSSDSRIKKNITEYTGALDAIKNSPRVVSFEYDHPNWGGDRAAPDDENARKWGPNARGKYVGFIAQETIDWAPWVVNAGAGKDCPECSKGVVCDNPDHGYWHVEYQHLVPMLCQCVKELLAKVEKLESGSDKKSEPKKKPGKKKK